jgi:hypothetical protein
MRCPIFGLTDYFHLLRLYYTPNEEKDAVDDGTMPEKQQQIRSSQSVRWRIARFFNATAFPHIRPILLNTQPFTYVLVMQYVLHEADDERSRVRKSYPSSSFISETSGVDAVNFAIMSPHIAYVTRHSPFSYKKAQQPRRAVVQHYIGGLEFISKKVKTVRFTL